MARRKHRKLVQPVELDITAFMNLMIVLVPVLLLSMVFTQNAVLDLNFPTTSDNNIAQLNENLQLQVIVRENGINIADTKIGLLKHIPKKSGQYDFEVLSNTLQLLKQKLPNMLLLISDPIIDNLTKDLRYHSIIKDFS